jgi:hypothetical protein
LPAGASDKGINSIKNVRDDAVKIATKFINDNKDIKVLIKCVGHSRGAVAAGMIGSELSKIKSDKVDINVVMFDPVPGPG